ncbi:aromatic amino acid transaminase [Leisingera daeponensis]|uniref:aromatic amino acid transaminase n=1 Tax=Leisingera daeponensis TaxID=405746 RepID=UPI0004020843|nr:aromatic amino acid transaminase [Leisingera daeponensis]
MSFFPSHIDVPEDPILGLVSRFRADGRVKKCDLGIGVYKDVDGRTPVFAAVKEAERRLLRMQETKTYTGLQGNSDYTVAVCDLVFGADYMPETLASAQVPGGSFALSLASMMVSKIAPAAVIWTSTPGWSSYEPLLLRDQLAKRDYTYAITPDGKLDVALLLRSLDAAQPGDIVVLQANCHNPTGIDPSPQDWAKISDYLHTRALVPLIDFAYQGLSDHPDADAYAVRRIFKKNSEAFVAVTNSKNFGLYRERTGCLYVQASAPETAKLLQGLMNDILRRYHAMPPDHGASVVAQVLGDSQLRVDWLTELEAVRRRLEVPRIRLADRVAAVGIPALANAVRAGRGMFTRLPLDANAITRLREDHSIYLTGDGRINLCGLTDENFDRVTGPLLAAAITAAAKREPVASHVY